MNLLGVHTEFKPTLTQKKIGHTENVINRGAEPERERKKYQFYPSKQIDKIIGMHNKQQFLLFLGPFF